MWVAEVPETNLDFRHHRVFLMYKEHVPSLKQTNVGAQTQRRARSSEGGRVIIELSYEEARRQYPDKVDEVMTKLRKGKSRHRDAAPEELEWSIEYGVLVPGQLVTFADLIAGRSGGPGRPKIWGKPRPATNARVLGQVVRGWPFAGRFSLIVCRCVRHLPEDDFT